MAGRIRDEDIAAVRERIRADEVIRDYVALRPAGGGSLQGLCPFHDERTPSFNVNPGKGVWHCFGCQEGGDVLTFVQKIDHLTFTEAVEKLAARVGVQLRYAEGSSGSQRLAGQRTRLVAANAAAAAFFTDQLQRPEAQVGRTFLSERGFDAAATEHFGVGFAPPGWDPLTNHLRAQGFSDTEMLTAGLVAQGQRGVYDRFRGRLVWPIRELSGDVVGFGARRLLEDDNGPKYLNTPETPLYRKSQVLYGIDLARKQISAQQLAVVVEGYTDVMACHLSGVETAVATCGTAFGADHIRVLRRLLMDAEEMRGRVVFTFDGDAAGRKAALRAFEDDQRFVAETFVAVEPNGLDPCELRQQEGPEGLRALIESPVPLFEFALRSTLADIDLDRPEGRVAGLRAAAPVVSRIRDVSLRPEYSRLLAGWLGMEVEVVLRAVADAGRQANRQPAGGARHGQQRSVGPGVEQQRSVGAGAGHQRPGGAGARPQRSGGPGAGQQWSAGSSAAGPVADGRAVESRPTGPSDRQTISGPDSASGAPEGQPGGRRSTPRPDPRNPVAMVEREALKCLLQEPALAVDWLADVDLDAFTIEAYQAVHAAIRAAAPTLLDAAAPDDVGGSRWAAAVLDRCADDDVRRDVRGLLVEPIPIEPHLVHRYLAAVLARLLERATGRRIRSLKAHLERTSTTDPSYDPAFADLMDWEAYRRALRDRVAAETGPDGVEVPGETLAAADATS